jgi:hypothetical protein
MVTILTKKEIKKMADMAYTKDKASNLFNDIIWNKSKRN